MYPVSGAFSTFGTRFVSPALGFTLGEFKIRLLMNRYEMYGRLELLVAMVRIKSENQIFGSLKFIKHYLEVVFQFVS